MWSTRSLRRSCLQLSTCLLCWAGAMPASGATTLTQDCPDCPRMVTLDAGRFQMGVAGHHQLLPVHSVTIAYRFALAETEVTRAQFRYFLSRTGYTGGYDAVSAQDPALPVTGIDWFAAQAYARWLARHTGQRYRLPSEAEWEYAARAGTRTLYWWGDARADGCGKEHLGQIFFDFSGACGTADDTVLRPVASAGANPWGLFDLLGNADEWLADCRGPAVLAYAEAPTDGSAERRCTFHDTERVIRGGGDFTGAISRKSAEPGTREPTRGFRVLKELP